MNTTAPTAQTGLIYTPPERAAAYIAYTKAPRREQNTATGEAVDFRSSIFMREYPSVLPKSVDRFDSGGGKVTFDAASIDGGPKRDFSAFIDSDPIINMLETSLQHRAAVTVVIEQFRRWKHRDTEEQIDQMVLIGDLKNGEESGKQTKSIVVGVAPVGHLNRWVMAEEIRSNPAEWASLRPNTKGNLPPNGWRTYEGGIILSANSTGANNTDDLADRVAAKLADIFAAGTPNSGPVAKSGEGRSHQGADAVRPTVREGAMAAEEREWKPWNSDGRLNLGGYLIAKDRAVYAEAYDLISQADPDGDPATWVEQAWVLVPVLLYMADTIQAAVYGDGARPDRTAKSHFEASKWAQFVYTTLAVHQPECAFTKEALTNPTARKAWGEKVIGLATGLYRNSAANVTAHLTGDSPQQPTGGPSAGGSTDRAAQSGTDSAATGTNSPTSAPSPQAPAQAASKEPETAPQGPQSPAPGNAGAQQVATQVTDDQIERYKQVLDKAGLTEFESAIHPLLQSLFGAWVLQQIPASGFETHLKQWEASPKKFANEAREAFQAAQQNQGSSNGLAATA